MLETRNLTKIYKPKKGVPVKAVDNVSLKLPDKGMVFLLGKSGSGKSTLLNLLGGLDQCTDGEIIIKGVSSKSFKQSHFDSYRNTYVGFIFQEYNILDEFTVAANIGLALELQGKKADSETVEKILHEVDLDGYGQRKPNELSGGQKQRVAIARALVKQPEIIMADEPTGALDSNTGKQVFDTLKKLSYNKLVLVVSHDREFAEGYADRIIEMADGKIISDLELDTSEVQSKPEEESSKIEFTDEGTVEISGKSVLTEDDIRAINEYLAAMKDGKLTIRQGKGKKVGNKRFKETDQTGIVSNTGSAFKLIKSRLPLKNAFRIGASGLKYKKFRLVVTIFLSVVAFGLFGLADTFGAYDHINTCTNSIIDSKQSYAALVKSYNDISDGALGLFDGMYIGTECRISDNDIKQIKEETGRLFKGVFVPSESEASARLEGYDQGKMSDSIKGDYSVYSTTFAGFAEIDKTDLDAFGYSLEGRLPENDHEIALSKHLAKTYADFGYKKDPTLTEANFEKLSSESGLIGKTLYVYGESYTVTGIVDTKFDFDRYSVLQEENKTSADMILKYALYNEFSSESKNSLTNVVFTCEGFIQRYAKVHPVTRTVDSCIGYLNLQLDQDMDYNGFVDYYSILTLSETKEQGLKIIWLDGKEKAELSDNEFIASSEGFGIFRSNYDRVALDSEEDIKNFLKKNFSFSCYGKTLEKEIDSSMKLVGIIVSPKDDGNDENGVIPVDFSSQCAVFSDSLINGLAMPDDWIYQRAVAPMPTDRNEIKSLVTWSFKNDTKLDFDLESPVLYELNALNSFFKAASKGFLAAGIFFAIFASIMFANFIATSISHKKQEIGILRAIGSRSRDVFLIFFSESFIIAMINFVLAAVGAGLLTLAINGVVRNEMGLLLTVLNFGIRQIALIFGVSLLVSFLASFLPTMKIASKKPVDAIRNR